MTKDLRFNKQSVLLYSKGLETITIDKNQVDTHEREFTAVMVSYQ